MAPNPHDDPLESTMNTGAVSVKLTYMTNQIEKATVRLEELRLEQTRHDGLMNSFQNHKEEMEDLKIEKRLDELEDWRQSTNFKKEKALERKQSDKGIWVPVIISIIMFAYTIWLEMSR